MDSIPQVNSITVFFCLLLIAQDFPQPFFHFPYHFILCDFYFESLERKEKMLRSVQYLTTCVLLVEMSSFFLIFELRKKTDDFLLFSPVMIADSEKKKMQSLPQVLDPSHRHRNSPLGRPDNDPHNEAKPRSPLEISSRQAEHRMDFCYFVKIFSFQYDFHFGEQKNAFGGEFKWRTVATSSCGKIERNSRF